MSKIFEIGEFLKSRKALGLSSSEGNPSSRGKSEDTSEANNRNTSEANNRITSEANNRITSEANNLCKDGSKEGGSKNEGVQLKPKMTYRRGDALDYMALSLLSMLVCHLVYGNKSWYTRFVDLTVLFFMIPNFLIRFGTSIRIPNTNNRSNPNMLIAVPLYWAEGLYITFRTRLDNCRMPWIRQFAALIIANLVLRLPNLVFSNSKSQSSSSGIDSSRTGSSEGNYSSGTDYYVDWIIWGLTFGLFYLSFTIVTVFRTLSYLDHLRQQNWVFQFLNQTSWAKMLQFVGTKNNTYANQTIALTHAYLTGIWTNILTVIPWFLLTQIWHQSFQEFATSVLQLLGSIPGGAAVPAVLAVVIPAAVVIVLLTLFLYLIYVNCDRPNLTNFEDDHLNLWYIKDHYLGHHIPFDFNFFHGPHHDCMPVGFIGVAGNGPLEGLLRHSLMGHLDSFMIPPFTAFLFTKMIIRDIFGHQYVPGCFPYSREVVNYGVHHVEHHFLSLYPLGNGMDTSNWKKSDNKEEGEQSNQGKSDNKEGAEQSNEGKENEKCKKKEWDALVNSNEIEAQVFGYREQNKLWTWFCAEVKAKEGI